MQKTPAKTNCWAATFEDIFKNPYAKATNGQQPFAGLTDDGEEQHNEHLNAVIEARKDPVKRKLRRTIWPGLSPKWTFSVPIVGMRLLAETKQIPRKASRKTHRWI